ncbi:hypothetical protein QFZ98_004662 [Paraburkholderia youngii]
MAALVKLPHSNSIHWLDKDAIPYRDLADLSLLLRQNPLFGRLFAISRIYACLGHNKSHLRGLIIVALTETKRGIFRGIKEDINSAHSCLAGPL